MIQIEKHERENILNNHMYFNESDLCFWYNEINERLAYLMPLIKELHNKNLSLATICEELNQEVFEIRELKKILKKYKVTHKNK